jgi:hypothetical protein
MVFFDEEKFIMKKKFFKKSVDMKTLIFSAFSLTLFNKFTAFDTVQCDIATHIKSKAN